MLIFKGFAFNSGYINNTPGVVSAFGELSANSLTYTKEQGIYINRALSQAVGIRSFNCTVDDSAIALPTTEADSLIKIAAEVYDYAALNAGRALTNEDHRVNLVTKHSAIVDQLSVGPVIGDDGIYVPQFLAFKIRNLTGSSADNHVTLWFSDESFQIRYPDSEIVIVPPIERLDDFFKPGVQVEAFLAELTMSAMVAKMQRMRDKNPMTFIRTDSFDYHDPANASRIIPVDWGTLIYGVAGNNIDSIKEALEDFILSNSQRTRDEWAVIFPEIFRKNEFVIVPIWNAIAIDQQLHSEGMYSQQLGLKKALEYLVRSVSYYPRTHVEAHGQVSGYPHKSVGIVSIGHFENANGKFALVDIYRDWINTNTNQDFNRMEPDTRTWQLKLANAVAHAEVFDETMVVPLDLMKVKRGDKLYLTFSENKINYLVQCKSSVLAPWN